MLFHKVSDLIHDFSMPMEVSDEGYVRWTDQAGETHRDDGPAVIRPDGLLEFFSHGDCQRVVYPTGEIALIGENKKPEDRYVLIKNGIKTKFMCFGGLEEAIGYEEIFNKV